MFFPSRPPWAAGLRVKWNGGGVATTQKKGKRMKTTMLSVIGCALLTAGVLSARAQTTNVTLNVNINLTGVAPSNDAVARIKISTKDVINAIAAQAGTNVSTHARLL